MFRTYLLCCFTFLLTSTHAQTIKGTFPALKGQSMRLLVFEGLQNYTIDSVIVSDKGQFSLDYASKDHGMGVLMTAENKPFFVILDPEGSVLSGELGLSPESVMVNKGLQNQQFAQFASEHPRREQALSAWDYLEKIYRLDPLFSVQSEPVRAIRLEKQRIKAEDSTYLAKLNPKTFVSWFLPTRKLVSDVSTIAQYRAEEIPLTIAAFRKLDYSDQRLYKSGLFKDAIESHFWLLENCGKPLDSIYLEMKTSIDAVIATLSGHERKLNEVTDYLFDLLERHSLFQASEYLALKVLNEVSCTIDNDLAKQLETYRAMKVGNTAPEITFKGKTLVSGVEVKALNNLSQIQSKNMLVVFGASWCQTCATDVPKIASLYTKWKAQGLEVVFVSLDTNEVAFMNFAKSFPFISYTDFKRWESPVVNDYYVFATPTMFILDPQRKIVLRPSSVSQVDSWVDWFLGSKKQ